MTYSERGSKNNNGTSKSFRYENKEVPCPAIPDEQPRCLVFLMDIYLSKLPPYAFEHDVLYLRPKRTVPSDPTSPWYDNIPVGKNTLSTMVKDMFSEVNIQGKSNHSLRASGATALFQKDVPERIVQKVTGHKSLDALRSYEKISLQQHQNVSKILMSNTTSETVNVKSGDQQQTIGSLGGINHCSIGNITFNIGTTKQE